MARITAQSLLPELLRFLRYGAVGIVTNTSLYVIYLGLLYLGLSPQLAVGLCYGLGVAMSYVLNRSWTFKSAGKHSSDLPKFLLAYGIGLVFTIWAITVLTRFMPAAWAQLPNILLTALVIYSALRLLRFGQPQGGPDSG